MVQGEPTAAGHAVFPTIPRRLEKYPPGAQPFIQSSDDLARDLAREPAWYGIVSAAGTGKTKLLDYLVKNLRATAKSHAVIALDPIDLTTLEKLSDPDAAMTKLREHIDTELVLRHWHARPGTPARTHTDFVDWMLHRLSFDDGAAERVLLLSLNNLDRLPDSVMRVLHLALKELYNRVHHQLVCVLVSDSNLTQTGRDISPLENIVDQRTLLDYDTAEWDALRRIAGKRDLGFRDDAWELLIAKTEGYPYLVSQVFKRVSESSTARNVSATLVQKIVDEILHEREPIRPFQTALAAVERWSKGHLKESGAVQPLLTLIESKSGSLDSSDEAQVEPLILKGIARRMPTGRLVWRNPMVQEFFKRQAEAIKQWRAEQQAPGHRLQAKGRVRVTLFLNLSRFIDTPDKKLFNAARATPSYAHAVERLEQRMSALPVDARRFTLTTGKDRIHQAGRDDSHNEDRIRNIGSDLNIFTWQAAQRAFAPVYYLKNSPRPYSPSSTLANRVGERQLVGPAEGLVLSEWDKWDTMSVQLMHEGTACIRLVQEITGQDERGHQTDIQPLSSVLHNVLGLETEISGDMDALRDKIVTLLEQHKINEAQKQLQWRSSFEDRQKARQQNQLSVQWEIAMALVEMLLRDLFGAAGDGHDRPSLLWEDTAFSHADPGKAGANTLHIVPGGTCEPGNPTYPLHDRYVIFEFDKLCDCPPEAAEDHTAILDAKDLAGYRNRDRQREIAGLLEGVAIGPHTGGDPDARTYSFPDIKPEYAREQIESDLSSWSGELCILTVDNALVYHKLMERTREPQPPQPNDRCQLCSSCGRHEHNIMHDIRFPTKHVDYPDYWRATIRGLEYLIGIRLVARLAAHITADCMAELENVAVLQQAELYNGRDALLPSGGELIDLRARASSASRLLSLIREASIPLYMASADYAARKFDSLIKLSGIREAIASAEANLRDLNVQLSHLDELELERSNRETLQTIAQLNASIQEQTEANQTTLEEIRKLSVGTVASNYAAIVTAIIIGVGLAITTTAQLLADQKTADFFGMAVLPRNAGLLVVGTWLAVLALLGLCTLGVMAIVKWERIRNWLDSIFRRKRP